MCGQYHHVIPRELGTWLFQEYSLEWDDNFKGHTVWMAQCGRHGEYTKKIRSIIEANYLPDESENYMQRYQEQIKQFSRNLIKEIKAHYSGFQPDDIPEAALRNCFPGAVPYVSSKGRTLKTTKDGSWIK